MSQPVIKEDFKPQKGSSGLGLILLLGVVSLFGDVVYEAARSITGPYLLLLGAGAGALGFVTGLGESLGYLMRLISGYLSDRIRAYWPFAFVGYALILFVPLLGYVSSWKWAGLFLILERMGKGIRAPSRDVILSHATKEGKRGVGFGIHEALDQVGAILGPLLISQTLAVKNTYKDAFSFLWIPAFLCVAFLFVAWSRFHSSLGEDFEDDKKTESHKEWRTYKAAFWSYVFFSFFTIMGFTNFQILSYHFKFHLIISDTNIPLFYAIAMAVDALCAIIMGKIYDKKGFMSLIVIPILSSFIPMLFYSRATYFVLISMIFFGLAMGAQESIMRAAIIDLAPAGFRASAYGIFHAVFGISCFLGSSILGFLYDISINYLVSFVLTMQAIAIALLFISKTKLVKL